MTAVVRFICLGLATIALSSTQARAEIVLNLGLAGDSSTIGQTAFNITPGSTLRLDLYATQQDLVTIPGLGDFSDLRLSTVSDSTGVGAFIMDATTFNGTTSDAATDVVPTVNVTPGTGFFADSPPEFTPPNGLRFQGVGGVALPEVLPVYATNLATPVQNVPTPGSLQENSVLLSTFELSSVATANGTFTLRLAAPDGLGFTLGNDLIGGANVNLPVLTATVTAVPEPGMFAALGVVACGIGYRQRRKAKRVKETQPLA